MKEIGVSESSRGHKTWPLKYLILCVPKSLRSMRSSGRKGIMRDGIRLEKNSYAFKMGWINLCVSHFSVENCPLEHYGVYILLRCTRVEN